MQENVFLSCKSSCRAAVYNRIACAAPIRTKPQLASEIQATSACQVLRPGFRLEENMSFWQFVCLEGASLHSSLYALDVLT